MSIPTYHELDENGEGNGVIHWYDTDHCRNVAVIPPEYGEVVEIELDDDDVPEGTRCETCGSDIGDVAA